MDSVFFFSPEGNNGRLGVFVYRSQEGEVYKRAVVAMVNSQGIPTVQQELRSQPGLTPRQMEEAMKKAVNHATVDVSQLEKRFSVDEGGMHVCRREGVVGSNKFDINLRADGLLIIQMEHLAEKVE